MTLSSHDPPRPCDVISERQQQTDTEAAKMADVVNVGVNLDAFSHAISGIQALRSSVSRVFESLKDGMKNRETLEGREKQFIAEFQDNLQAVNRDLKWVRYTRLHSTFRRFKAVCSAPPTRLHSNDYRLKTQTDFKQYVVRWSRSTCDQTTWWRRWLLVVTADVESRKRKRRCLPQCFWSSLSKSVLSGGL